MTRLPEVHWRYAQAITWPLIRDRPAHNFQAARWLMLRKVDTSTEWRIGHRVPIRGARETVRAYRKCVRSQQSAVLCGMRYL